MDKYTTPTMELVTLEVEDVIMTSIPLEENETPIIP